MQVYVFLHRYIACQWKNETKQTKYSIKKGPLLFRPTLNGYKYDFPCDKIQMRCIDIQGPGNPSFLLVLPLCSALPCHDSPGTLSTSFLQHIHWHLLVSISITSISRSIIHIHGDPWTRLQETCFVLLRLRFTLQALKRNYGIIWEFFPTFFPRLPHSQNFCFFTMALKKH